MPTITQLLRRKPWMILLAILCSAGDARAQVSLYSFSQPTVTGYVPVTGGVVAQATGTTGATSLDDVSYPISLPFVFNFGGAAFSNANVNSNGSVTFGTNTTTAYSSIADNTAGGGVIAAFALDLRGIFATTVATTASSNVLTGAASIGTLAVGQTITGTGIPAGTTITAIGTSSITMSASATATSTSITATVQAGHIDTATIGTAPNRTFVVQWTGFQIYAAANTSVNFQVRLSEGGGIAANQTVSIVYGSFLDLASSGTAQVGLRGNANNTDFNDRSSTTSWSSTTAGASNTATVSYSSTNLPGSGLIFLYTPPPGCTGTPTAGTATAATNPVCAGGTTALSLAGTSSGTGIGVQWQSSTDNITFNSIVGATTASYTASVGNVTTYFRAVVTCNGVNPNNSNTLTVTVTNPPVTASLPFTESFESWISACGTNDRPGINWITNPVSGNNAWRRDDSGSTASWTSPTGGVYSPVFTTGAHSARFHSTWAPTPLQGNMDLYVNLSATGAKLISFDHINTSGSDVLYVELSVNGGASFSTLGTLGINSAWTPVSFLTSSTAASAIIRLRAATDYGSTDIGVDNFKVFVASCLAPTSPVATALTPTSASLGFTVSGPPTPVAYQIQYGSSSFVLGSGTNVFTSTNPYPISGLTGGNSYSFFVRAICGPGDTSAYTSRFVFTTPCGSSPLPFAEQFNTYLPNSCWAEAVGQLTPSGTLTGTSSAWLAGNYLNAAATNPAPRINLYTNSKKDWFTTASINLGTTTASSSFVLEFNVGVVNWTTTTPTTMGSDDTVAVVISTDNGATWSKSNAVMVFTAANTPVSASGGQRYFIPLDNYSGTIKIGFYASEGTVDDAPDYDVFIDSILVRTCARPAVALGNDTTLCPGATVTLNAGNVGSSYLFSNNATTQSTQVTAAGTHSVRVTNTQGCVGRDTIVLTAVPNPTVNLGNDTSICPATAITLNAGNAGSSYLYSNSATTQTTSVTAGGTYDVRVTSPQGCVGRDTIVIAQAVNPVVNLGNDTVICPAATITLDAGNPGSSYLFSNAATTQTTNVTAAGSYNVRVTNAQKCIGRDTIVLTAGVNPVVNLGNDTLLCPGDTIRLNAGNAGSTYLYSNSVTTQIANITLGGTYNVRVTNAGKCVGRDTINIASGVNPIVKLGNDTSFCPGASILLNAGNPGHLYLYSNSATTQTITVATAGTYSVRVTNPVTGCRGRDTIVIGAASNPVVNLGSDTAICPGKLITLNAGNAGSTYLYNTGATTQTLAVTASGSYSVRVTNSFKCIGRDTIVISQGVDPVVNLGRDTSVCSGTAFTLDAGNPGSTYLYSTGATTRTLSVIPTGLYAVEVTNAQKCVGRDTIFVVAIPLAAVNFITQTKIGSSVAFGSDAQFSIGYAWAFGDGTTGSGPNPVHTYPSNGVYTVRLIVSNPCGNDTSITTVTISGVGTGTVSLSKEELRIYPNPSSGRIIIDNQSSIKMKSVTVLNSLGAVVMQKDGVAPDKEMLDLGDLPTGTYMIHIHTEAGVFLRRLQLLR